MGGAGTQGLSGAGVHGHGSQGRSHSGRLEHEMASPKTTGAPEICFCSASNCISVSSLRIKLRTHGWIPNYSMSEGEREISAIVPTSEQLYL